MGAPIRHSDFIGGLCVALEHRWVPERLFVIFTAYFDEAATHGNPRMTMGALLGNAYEWNRVETKLARLQKRNGFTIFHAKEFKSHSGEFRGWPASDYPQLVSELTDLIRTGVTEAVAVTIPRARYISEYRNSPTPKGMRLDSQYGLCFRACMAQIASIITDRGGKSHTLHVVIERGHKNVMDCERIFHEMKETLKSRGVNLFGTFTIAAKDDPKAKPLMIADFLSHSHYLFDDSSQAGRAPTYAEMTVGIPNQKYDAGFTMLDLPPESMRALKQLFADERQRKMDKWRAARDAKKSVSLQERIV